MIIATNETLQEFITNHLDVEDFGYLVLATDDRLNHEALCIIRGKLNAFLKGEGESDMKESVHGKVVGGGGVGGDIGNVHGNAGCLFSNVAKVIGKAGKIKKEESNE
jgi:hypothetical protein